MGKLSRLAESWKLNRPAGPSATKGDSGVANCAAGHSGSKLEDFHSFPLLPPELRLKIWRELLPGPRLVEIRSVHRKDTAPAEWWSPTPPPQTLWICHDSRMETLKQYQRSFATEQRRDAFIYFNADLDTLYFGQPTAEHELNQFVSSQLWSTKEGDGEKKYITKDLLSVRQLAVNCTCYYTWAGDISFAAAMRNVERLTLVLENPFAQSPVPWAASPPILYDEPSILALIESLRDALAYIPEELRGWEDVVIRAMWQKVSPVHLRLRRRRYGKSLALARRAWGWQDPRLSQKLLLLSLIPSRLWSLLGLSPWSR